MEEERLLKRDPEGTRLKEIFAEKNVCETTTDCIRALTSSWRAAAITSNKPNRATSFLTQPYENVKKKNFENLLGNFFVKNGQTHSLLVDLPQLPAISETLH